MPLTQALLRQRANRIYRLTGSGPVDHGTVINDYLQGMTSGTGGDYPTGDVWIEGGRTYTWNVLDMTDGYARAYDPSKPYNNWLRVRVWPGTGDAIFNLAADSTGAFANATGGGMHVLTGGSARWIFDGSQGPMIWENGAIRTDADLAFDRCMWWNVDLSFTPAEFDRQYIATSGGANLKGNFEPTPFRFHRNATRQYILRCYINECCDDGVFAGGGLSDYIDVIGCAINHIDDAGLSYGFHNDAVQTSGAKHLRVLDSTLLMASLQLIAENGESVTNMVIDRVTQAFSNGAKLGALGPVGSGTMNNTNQIAQGAPTTRISGHYLHAFANGITDHGDGAAAQRCITAGATTPHVCIIDYDGLPNNHDVVINSAACTVFVPTGVSPWLDSDGLPTNLELALAATLVSSESSHRVFWDAYGATELMAALSDYGILLD